MERRNGDNLTDEKKASKFRTTQLNELLKEERSKALQCLQGRTDQGEQEKNSANGSVQTQYAATSTTATATSTSSRAYVPYSRYREDANISDLITDTSITLHISDFSMPKGIEDVSFRPAEMTGRSTAHQSDSKPRKPIKYSVDQILASSIVEHVRELRNSNIGPNGSITSGNRLSSASSCISGFSAMQKNPRLTYMPSIESEHSRYNNPFDFSFQGNKINASNDYGDEEFAPAEMMQSQLIKDEISWAKERAVLPTAVLSEEARRKLPAYSGDISEISYLNSISFNDMNFSAGQFFGKGSADIDSMIERGKSKIERTPVALIDDSIIEKTMSTTYDSPEKPIQLYVDITTPVNKTSEVANSLLPEKNHSKDSGNATEKSDRLRSLEYERIQYNLDIAAGDMSVPKPNYKSSGDVFSIKEPDIRATSRATDEADCNVINGDNNLKEITNIIMENKENIQLYGNCSKDTLSFTESLLNTSIQNYRMSNVGQARSPLSPIPIMIAEHDADIDEFTNSPVVTPMRRKKYTKSPRSSPLSSISANAQNVEEILTEQLQLQLQDKPKIISVEQVAVSVTPCLPTLPVAETTGVRNKKSLCSTRLGGDRNSAIGGSHSDILSNFSKTTCTRALTPTYNGVNTYEISPLSSPCSYLSSLPVSPLNSDPTINIANNHHHNKQTNKNCCCSPNGGGDCLAASSSLRRVATSPCQSEASTNKYNNMGTNQCGIPPMRTYSSNSVKSCDGTSTSSNNSEFSHRDGKIMPIKVTAFELSWPSVKLRTASQKSLQVKNTSNKRLNLRIQIIGPGFQLINPDSNILTLSSQECRTIIVNFNPTMIGPAIGKLILLPPRVQNVSSISNSSNNNNPNPNPNSPITANSSNTTNHEVTIPLYAYGGHAQIAIQDLSRGPVGAPYIPMGEFCTLVRPLERSFKIYNRGPLLGFVTINVEPNGSHLTEICQSLRVQPELALIPPQTAIKIRVVFEPNPSDIRKLRNYIIDEVMTLAKLRIIYGDEAIRQRLRQIQRLMTVEEREKIFTRSLDKLWERFPDENTMFTPGLFRDSGRSVAHDMWAYISEKEVALTVNNNMLDETAADLSTIFTEEDNSVLFRTVCISPPTKIEESHPIPQQNKEHLS